jgi:hypothetical protein
MMSSVSRWRGHRGALVFRASGRVKWREIGKKVARRAVDLLQRYGQRDGIVLTGGAVLPVDRIHVERPSISDPRVRAV